MGRTVAVVWHASFSIAAGVLYFFFVLPRWPELLGDTSHTLGTVLRIVTGALIGIAALPVVFTLLRTRRPEFGTPALALRLRTSSIALHVLASVLIIGTAISEIWLNIDSMGEWLFGTYGAAAAIALLGIFAFYLAFVAELPPPPPKPLKLKKAKQGRGRRNAAEAEADVEPVEAETEAEVGEATSDEQVTESEGDDAAVTVEAADADESTAVEAPADEDEADNSNAEAPKAADSESSNGKLRNRRPSGKTPPRRRRRLRGGVAVEE
jgi:hypothetical protein